MDFRQVEVFAYIVRYKSFSKAADALFLTQPTISSHLNSLENDLGTKLIDRSRKDIVPTKSGLIFYDYALKLINTRDNAISKLNEYSNDISGKIDIAASTVPCQWIIPALVGGFANKYNNVTFSITQMDSKEVTEKILQKEMEIGIVGSVLQNDKLIYKRLKDDKLVLIAPCNKKFNDIHSNAISIQAIKDENFIFRESGSGTRTEFEKVLKKAGLNNHKTIKILSYMSSTEAIIQSVRLGVGVSIVSSISVEDYVKFGQLKAFDIEEMDLRRAFYFVHHKNIPLSPISIAFMDYSLNFYKS